MASMRIIVFDGDDTLWDTSSVFYSSQLKALEEISKHIGGLKAPVEEYKTLRVFDDLLIQYNDRSEYDFSMLFLVLIKHYKHKIGVNESIQSAVKLVESGCNDWDRELAAEICVKFMEDMRRMPSLYRDTVYTLKGTRDLGYVNVLTSEGDEERVNKVLEYYGLRGYFNEVCLFRKTPESYKDVVNGLLRKYGVTMRQVFVVGDLLDRDIYHGNLVNATTIHKPGGYKPDQVPQNDYEYPDFTVQNISDILPLLESIIYP